MLGVAVVGLLSWSGCHREPPPGPSVGGGSPQRASHASAVTATTSSGAPAASGSATAVAELPDAGAADAAWEGPWLGATAQITPVYPTARFSTERLGYLRRGSKAPAVASSAPIKTAACREGWYQLVDGGYVCGRYATLNVDDPRVRGGVTPANLDALLPYRYAYNTANGTPLYRSPPSREEMLRFEPYLSETGKKSKADAGADAEVPTTADQPSPAPEGTRAAESGGTGDEPADGGAGEPPPPDLAWWQKPAGESVQVKLADLVEKDGTLSRRMVKGFFIAIDRTVGANNRLWYKTTTGLLAPADRMVIPKAPELEGLAFPEGARQVGFVLAHKAHKWLFEADAAKPKQGSPLKRFQAVGLTGTTRLGDKQRYHETVDRWWLRESDGTLTAPGPLPSGLGSNEKWIDVNLTRKTLVAFEAERPVYAALVAPGKHSSDKKRDHRTPTGTFRIREKHVAVTMDGDGPVAGDMPYSIEDVPYVQYYDGSYALHGAFWHQNFGREQSHGCVNLSPRDSKWLFFWSDPQIPRGWHGVWADSKRHGTMVVIHE